MPYGFFLHELQDGTADIWYNSGMNGKTVIITGGNSGIGKATAAALAKKGAEVIIACRSKSRGEQARQEISKTTGSKLVRLMHLDLADFGNVRNFAEEFKRNYKKLDVLINNAGVLSTVRRTSRNGYELQFAVNHLGHFLLTAQLFDCIKKADCGRIINVTSGGHRLGKIRFDNIMLESGYTTFGAYARTKLANVLFTYSLAEKAKKYNISVNCLHPGVVATPIILNKRENTAKRLIMKLENLVFKSPEKGAETIVFLASDPDLAGSTGMYWANKKTLKSGKRSYDRECAEQLWVLSEELTGCKFEL